jgi:hypothetical protein
MTWEARGLDGVAEWYQEAPRLLPLLGAKPHVVVLSKGEYDFADPRAWRSHHQPRPRGLVHHPGAANFTFLSHGLDPVTRAGALGYIAANIVSVPFPSWVHFARASPEHWTAPAPTPPGGGAPASAAGTAQQGPAAAPGSPEPRVGPPFDGAEVAASKSLLVSMSFKTRMPFRHLLRRQCRAAPGRCGFLDVATHQVAVDRAGQPQNASRHTAELVGVGAGGGGVCRRRPGACVPCHLRCRSMQGGNVGNSPVCLPRCPEHPAAGDCPAHAQRLVLRAAARRPAAAEGNVRLHAPWGHPSALRAVWCAALLASCGLLPSALA